MPADLGDHGGHGRVIVLYCRSDFVPGDAIPLQHESGFGQDGSSAGGRFQAAGISTAAELIAVGDDDVADFTGRKSVAAERPAV